MQMFFNDLHEHRSCCLFNRDSAPNQDAHTHLSVFDTELLDAVNYTMRSFRPLVLG